MFWIRYRLGIVCNIDSNTMVDQFFWGERLQTFPHTGTVVPQEFPPGTFHNQACCQRASQQNALLIPVHQRWIPYCKPVTTSRGIVSQVVTVLVLWLGLMTVVLEITLIAPNGPPSIPISSIGSRCTGTDSDTDYWRPISFQKNDAVCYIREYRIK